METAAIDVSDEVAMTALMARFGQDGRHSGVSSMPSWRPLPRRLWTCRWTCSIRCSGPKSSSRNLIERLSANQPLEFFVDFSTTTAILGSSELAHYAAANAVLDALACRRRASGKPALSINWGTWDRMNVSRKDRERVARGGLRPMPTAVGLAALESLLAAGATRAIVVDADWRKLYGHAYESQRAQPLLSRVAASDIAPPSNAAEAAESLPPDVALLEKDVRRATLDRVVRRVVAEVVGLKSPQSIDAALSLFKMGLEFVDGHPASTAPGTCDRRNLACCFRVQPPDCGRYGRAAQFKDSGACPCRG